MIIYYIYSNKRFNLITNCEDLYIKNKILESSFQYNFNDLSLKLEKTYDNIEIIECEDSYTKKVINANILDGEIIIGGLRIVIKNDDNDIMLKIDSINITNEDYKNKGFSKQLHTNLDDILYPTIKEYQLSSKAENLIIWIRIGYRCMNDYDERTIKERLFGYLINKQIGKGYPINKAKYLISKDLKTVDKLIFFKDKDTNQIDYSDYYNKCENTNTNLDDLAIDENIKIEVLNLKNTIEMYRINEVEC